MAKVAIKRLAKHGNTLLIPIPAVMRAALSWLRGDFIELTLNDEQRTLTLKAVHPRAVGVEQPKRVVDTTEVSR